MPIKIKEKDSNTCMLCTNLSFGMFSSSSGLVLIFFLGVSPSFRDIVCNNSRLDILFLGKVGFNGGDGIGSGKQQRANDKEVH
jgi:hypothetical protein